MKLINWWRAFRSYHRRCSHTSHRAALYCWRPRAWDGYCYKHNDSCWHSCDRLDQERIDGPR